MAAPFQATLTANGLRFARARSRAPRQSTNERMSLVAAASRVRINGFVIFISTSGWTVIAPAEGHIRKFISALAADHETRMSGLRGTSSDWKLTHPASFFF